MNLPHIFQGLGAIASAFGDPRQSLMMSQNVFSEMETMRERKRRQEEQAKQLALRDRQLAMQEQAQQLEQMQYLQAQQRRAEADAYFQNVMASGQQQPSPGMQMAAGPSMAPAGGLGASVMPAVASGAGGDPFAQYAPVAAQAAYQPIPPPPPAGAGEIAQRLAAGAVRYGDDRMMQMAKFMRPDAASQAPNSVRVAQWYAQATPEERAAYDASKRAGAMQSNVYIDKNQGRPDSLRYDQKYGEAPKDMLYQRDAQGNVVEEPRYNERTQQTRMMPVLTPMKADDERSAELAKLASGVATGRRGLQRMREIDQGLDNTWGLGTRAAFAGNLPNTEGGRYRKEFEDVLDILIRLRTGAAATESEREGMRAIYMPSFIANAQTRREQLEHLERSISAYEEFRTRMGYAGNKPLTDEENETVLAEIDEQRAEAGLGPGLRMTKLPIPVSRAAIPDHTFVGYDAAKGIYLYTDEQGNMVQRRVVQQE